MIRKLRVFKMAFTSQETDDLAAQWAARRNLRDLTPEEQVEFDAWLTADIRHLGAYGRAEAVLARLERMSGVAIGELQARQKAEMPDLPRRRFILTGTIAASVAAAGVIGAAFWENSREFGVTTRASFVTGIGQSREILLADGSVITLNTNSKVAVELSANARNIRLERGEALFDVAKNKKRPFIVFAGDTQVRAVGTSFTVSMLPRRPIQVLVKEGVVELTHADAQAVAVGAHTRALAPHGSAIIAETISSTKLSRYLAWQYGRIALDNETLQDAATEFARYSGVRIVVDPAVANRTVTGMFASDDPVGFAKAAASVLKLHVEVNDETVRIFS
jgi:transmembrane sensor